MSGDSTYHSSPQPPIPTPPSEDLTGTAASSVTAQLKQLKRTDLLRRLNTEIASTRNLPSEVLSLIFQLAGPVLFNVPDFMKHYDTPGSRKLPKPCAHFVFAAVSSLWRQVVWSTPELWTLLFVITTNKGFADDIEFLGLYLQNSGDLPLSLKVGCTQWERGGPSQLLKGIIHETAARLKSLILINFSDESLTPLSTLTFPRLQELAVLNNYETYLSQLIINDAPSLQRFAICVMDNSWTESEPLRIRLPLSSITWANLRFIPSHIAIWLLQECRNLTDFAFGVGGDAGGSDGDLPLVRPLILPQLQSFGWMGYGGALLNNLLQMLHVPNLQALSVDFYAVDERRVWTDFFQRLPKSIKTLHLHGFPGAYEIDDHANLLHFVPSHGLQELALHHCRAKFVDGIFEALALFDEGTATPVFLPTLKTLLVVDYGEAVERLRGRMLDMVQQRYGNPSHSPQLSLTWWGGELFPEGVKLELLD